MAFTKSFAQLSGAATGARVAEADNGAVEGHWGFLSLRRRTAVRQPHVQNAIQTLLAKLEYLNIFFNTSFAAGPPRSRGAAGRT